MTIRSTMPRPSRTAAKPLIASYHSSQRSAPKALEHHRAIFADDVTDLENVDVLLEDLRLVEIARNPVEHEDVFRLLVIGVIAAEQGQLFRIHQIDYWGNRGQR